MYYYFLVNYENTKLNKKFTFVVGIKKNSLVAAKKYAYKELENKNVINSDAGYIKIKSIKRFPSKIIKNLLKDLNI